ncbi:SDR family NAD(P)-dependent oxidoreductase [Neomegalonema sp.]|uniref:SDR family NAD(P)-dependent oxidoreductase n=1 Tax=Neomegalonema sp. TaxID=2039713 RepID=UPI0026377085|nr:SDR family NAD(P)-dependent oxidoreductase [Neomegalonema sp.]MDD2867139.1 SDR family NAD(P)-dependent oxidoreductase [Neomegalonema sp.]
MPQDARKTILITGCSSGIGAASADLLRAKGWRVVAACRKPEDVARKISEGHDSVLVDHEDAAGVEAGYRVALEILGGRLDALFNNGAYAVPGMVEDLPREALEAIFAANLFGPHQLTRLALKTMRAQDEGRGSGRIVQCSSVLGFAAARARGAYNSTKFALEGLTDTLRLELRGGPIKAILIEPGPIATPFRRNAALQYARWIKPLTPDSFWRELYAGQVEPRLRGEGKKDRWELGPEAVAQTLLRALEAREPKARYRVTFPTKTAALMKRILPQRAFDAISAKA